VTQPSWKQEVNRRLTEHKIRKGISVVDHNAPEGTQGTTNSRAAAAAARVAERYAKAPTYSEMLAAEAHASLRQEEAATRAAVQAQAVAQTALQDIEASDEEYEIKTYEDEPRSAHVEEPENWPAWRNPEPTPAASQSLEIKWDSDMPIHSGSPDRSEVSAPSWWASPHSERTSPYTEQIIEHVEAAQPMHANLIEFPRELVAPRRMRPRLTDSHTGTAEPYSQLSIFELDPSTISIDPAVPPAHAHMPSWSGHEWRAIELDDRRAPEHEYHSQAATQNAPLHQAPIRRRLMATMIDVALIFSVVCAIAALAASKLQHLPGMKVSELTAVVVVGVVAMLYEYVFLLYAKCTPGMRYAELSLCTFDDEYPTREQMKARLVAMLLSLLPMGLGMLWAIFDEDNMSWHDRHSRTYLRLS
jgi:uncharacterized RDD family membrane protein YckC